MIKSLFKNMMERATQVLRKFSKPTLNDIKKEFPILFQLERVIFHFNKLTSKKIRRFTEN